MHLTRVYILNLLRLRKSFSLACDCLYLLLQVSRSAYINGEIYFGDCARHSNKKDNIRLFIFIHFKFQTSLMKIITGILIKTKV